MSLPNPAEHHYGEHLVKFSDGFTVTFRLRLIEPSVEDEILSAGEKRARERQPDVDPVEVTVNDVAVDFLSAGIVGFYTSKDSTLVDFTHEHAAEMWAGPDAWTAHRREIFDAVRNFAATGKVDPKAESTPNAAGG